MMLTADSAGFITQAPVFVPTPFTWFAPSVQVFPSAQAQPSSYSQPIIFVLLQLVQLVQRVLLVWSGVTERTDYLKRLVAHQPPSRAGPHLLVSTLIHRLLMIRPPSSMMRGYY